MRYNVTKSTSALALLGAIACTDLSESPYTQFTEENLTLAPGDLPAILAAVYTPLRPMWTSWQGMIDWQAETADQLLTPQRPNGWVDGGIYVQNHQHTWTSSSPGMPNGLWGNAFNGVVAANRVTHQIQTGYLPLQGELKATILAEVRAMRAYYYSLLMDNFGGVPIVTDYEDRSLPEQASRQEVFDFVVAELTEAMPELSEATGTAMYGRMNRWAAKGILARVYLNAEVYTGTPKWPEVLAVTQEIIGSGRFRLDATYRGPFSRNNHTSPEIIFAVPYDAVNATQSNFHMKTMKPDLRYVFNLNTGPWGGSASNPQFIATYDSLDTRLRDTWLRGPHFTPPAGDPPDSVGYNFVQHVPAIRNDPGGAFRIGYHHGYPVWKYEIYSGMTGASDVDFPTVRYADVLLMRAEALLRTGDADGAAALVTQVRQRAFASTDPSKATVTGADLTRGSRYNYGWYDSDGVVKTGPGGTPVQNGGADIQYGGFLDELRWELAVEGQDRQILIRFGVFTTKTWFNHTPNGDHRTVFAIPQSRISTNPKLTQNPGY
jgi:starch-binding outer membrane protein, SusD/RagB family